MKSLLSIATLIIFLLPLQARATGIAIAEAPEQSFGVCFGDSSINTLNCAREKCAAAGESTRKSDCLRVLWCFPMGWTVDVFKQNSEGLHWHEYSCGWSSKEKALQASKIKCNDDFLIECSPVRIWTPKGEEQEVDFASLQPSAPTQDAEKQETPQITEFWELDTTPNRPSLTLYGGEERNDELLELDLSCDPANATMTILLRETSERFSDNETMCASVKTAKGATRFCGTTIPNGLAGVPDFEGIATEIGNFDLTGRKALSIKMKEYTQTISLAAAGEKTTTFTNLCLK